MTDTAPAPHSPPPGLGFDTTLGHGPRAATVARRIAFALLYLGTMAGFVYWLWTVLAPGGMAWIEWLILAAFAMTLPWLVLGFCNGLVGLGLMLRGAKGLAAIVPELRAIRDDEPIAARTAILYPIRNEDPARAVARLGMILDSLDATGQGGAFDAFVLSDTSDPAIAAAEEAAFATFRAGLARPERLTYRRRARNTGFKAGNVLDWCDRWGGNYEFMVTLDADSMMPGWKLVRMVRLMAANPSLGILQSLITALPAISAFPRIFQFGMRHGMRTYAYGQGWWQDDAGPYWGHNAVLRVAAFTSHARLPELPGKPPFGGPIMSHDQVEAVMMRKAGYGVRVLPIDAGSYEENPPTLLEFLRRNVRWGQGNLQYFKLLALRGIPPMGRVQFLHAILLYVVGSLWTILAALAALYPFTAAGAHPFPAGSAVLLALAYFALAVSPKLFGYLHTLLDARERAAFGGAGRVLAGIAIEAGHAAVLFPVMAITEIAFITRLLLGWSGGWGSQQRDAHAVAWSEAWRALRWPTIFAWSVLGALAAGAPAALPVAALVLLGPALSVPFAVYTADASVGRWFARSGLCAMPEELAPPPEIAALGLEAVALAPHRDTASAPAAAATA
ncbi:MAG: glucans biosynthesis glucosyltransferase MdoH [Alphaproteobacteria bacterium]|nr:glucans biosynthesis glucosyltransferase MdoH [Alphaproteobacteria bacterium]